MAQAVHGNPLDRPPTYFEPVINAASTVATRVAQAVVAVFTALQNVMIGCNTFLKRWVFGYQSLKTHFIDALMQIPFEDRAPILRLTLQTLPIASSQQNSDILFRSIEANNEDALRDLLLPCSADDELFYRETSELLTCIATLPHEERQHILDCSAHCCIGRLMSSSAIQTVIQRIARLSAHARDNIVENVRRLAPHTISLQGRLITILIDVLEACEDERRDHITTNTALLVTDQMYAVDIIALLLAVKEHDPIDPEILEIVTDGIMQPHMNAVERIRILTLIMGIPDTYRMDVVTCIRRLIPPQISIANFHLLLTTAHELVPLTCREVTRLTQRLISPTMLTHERIDILRAVEALPEERRHDPSIFDQDRSRTAADIVRRLHEAARASYVS